MKKYISLLIGLVVTCAAFAQRGQVEKAMHDKYAKQYGQPGLDKLNKFMNSKTESSYSFPLYINMKLTEYEDGKEEVSHVKYYANGDNFAFRGVEQEQRGRKQENMTIVFDAKNQSMIMLNEDELKGMALHYGMFQATIQQRVKSVYEEEMKNVKCNKTGKSKSIQGYSCMQYKCAIEDEDDDVKKTGEIWVSNQIKMDAKKGAGFGFWNLYFMDVAGINGMMMEGDFYEDGKLTSKMEITELNKKASYKIDMTKYQMGIQAGDMR